MSEKPACAITLRALEGEPLSDPNLRDIVVASARGLAERHGITVLELTTNTSSITVLLATGRIEAMGFAAELRRSTTAWYTRKYGTTTLWGDPAREDGDATDGWKRE